MRTSNNFSLRKQWTHLGPTLFLAAVSYPMCVLARLRVRGEFSLLLFLPAVVANGIWLATLLFGIQHPQKIIATLSSGDRRRFLLLIPVVIIMFVLYRPFDAALFAIAAVAVAEYLSAKKEPWKAELLACLIPATYFLLGFWLVYEFNDIIVTFRFYGAYDHTFLKIDRYLLLGGSVSGFGHWAMDHLPSIAFPFAEAVYYGAFAQIGAAVILVGINSGMSRSLQLVGTILLSYYLSLCCFAFWPSHGPYLLCENHFQNFPRELNSYAIQQIFLNNSRALWRHAGMLTSSGGYYISFPCMHVTQPLIIIWFLRSSRRIAAVLLAYDLVLVPSILVLEWHYAVDLIGGVVIAALAIWIITGRRHSPQPLADVSAACS